jgi:unconventional prefoldin RPB5 interactor 1
MQVPFGKFAFMPGKLYHTNEIMVLLGDNWFVTRSAKQALEIAERRKQCE